ncbi:unnamed protein product, partial [marine sediment metagenome]
MLLPAPILDSIDDSVLTLVLKPTEIITIINTVINTIFFSFNINWLSSLKSLVTTSLDLCENFLWILGGGKIVKNEPNKKVASTKAKNIPIVVKNPNSVIGLTIAAVRDRNPAIVVSALMSMGTNIFRIVILTALTGLR